MHFVNPSITFKTLWSQIQIWIPIKKISENVYILFEIPIKLLAKYENLIMSTKTI